MKGIITLTSIIAALLVFGFWMNIVGNPHVVETVMGVIISITVGVLVNRSLKNIFGLKEKK